ncbi:hypothetical protein [uncultured Flavobacterium sp.]|uniref:hypothetical protein n=1 Tax=uncultured Flavobacterium sp. TaxID=165435 RepID=UPI0025FA1833|nr:hypothetical protein [uncultured Flavobacterium sp.]
MDKIKELIRLLLADFELEEEDEQEILINLGGFLNDQKAYLIENDAEWILDVASESTLQFAISNEISEFIITGDKIDEIHEVIVEEFEGDFTEFPYEKKFNAAEYIEWVSKELSENYPDLELIEFGDSFGDSIQLMFVLGKDVKRIKELCEELNIRCNRADEILKL